MGPPESPLQVSALPCVLSCAHTSSSHLQTYLYRYLYLYQHFLHLCMYLSSAHQVTFLSAIISLHSSLARMVTLATLQKMKIECMKQGDCPPAAPPAGCPDPRARCTAAPSQRWSPPRLGRSRRSTLLCNVTLQRPTWVVLPAPGGGEAHGSDGGWEGRVLGEGEDGEVVLWQVVDPEPAPVEPRVQADVGHAAVAHVPGSPVVGTQRHVEILGAKLFRLASSHFLYFH